MSRVQRADVLDYVTYTERRSELRPQVLETKGLRRIHVGPFLTFLFENRDTVLYQIQEMMRLEQMVKESDIQHEIDTYNRLLGERGMLGCTLLIEIDDPALRDQKLMQWMDLIDLIYVRLEDGTKISALFDPKQVGDGKLSAVQYLKFNTGGRVPVAVGVAEGDAAGESILAPEQREALRRDLED